MKRNDPRVVPPQSPTNLNHFYPVAERDDSRANSVNGIGLGAAGNSSTENGYIRICTNKKEEPKLPLIEGLEGS